MLDDELLDVPFTFRERSTPLPSDLRPAWRIAVLLLLLDNCRGAQATLKQLHVLNWAIKDRGSQLAFLEFIHGEVLPSQVIVRYDPSLNRAIDFALAEGLVLQNMDELGNATAAGSHRLALSKAGRAIATEILSQSDCMAVEKDFLAAIGHKITQGEVESLFTWSK
jgi:hypothetical protein